MIDYYELLQISPKADAETIHRVYRFLAARLHPDNAKTGDAAKFRLVKTAYDVLVHPGRRAEYDAKHGQVHYQPQPLSCSIDFMDQSDGESNRRMAVLAVLYFRRRVSPNHPEVSLGEIEERMGFPRDYLDFTLWYLAKKRYIERADNITYSLTAEGVDFVEGERAKVPVLNGLLTSGSSSTSSDAEAVEEDTPPVVTAPKEIVRETVSIRQAHGARTIVLPSSMTATALEDDRRMGKKDRRAGEPDLRIIKVERRKGTRDRRATGSGKTYSN